MKALLLSKKGKPTVKEVGEYLKKHFNSVTIYLGKSENAFPIQAFKETADILISYLSPWIIPEKILRRTRLWNINFHPGPPEYPGIGCFNFAIYNKAKFYGVTAHLMSKRVDSGRIIAVKRFSLLKSDSVYSLSMKSYKYMLSLFFEVIDFIVKKGKLPHCNETWKRSPGTRKDLEVLCKIDPSWTKDEIERRIRATVYPNMPGPYVDIFGYRFKFAPDK